MSLGRIDIAKIISSKALISNATSKKLLDSFLDIVKSKSDTNDVKIANFGTFMNKVSPQRIGRNPKTGISHIITERVKLNLIVSKKVKDQLN
jgi:integration host factor subunit alpha